MAYDPNAFAATGSAGGPTKYLMKTESGVDLVAVDRDTLGEPSTGWKAKLKLIGIAEPFSMESQYPDDDGNKRIQKMTRFLIKVVDRDDDDYGVQFATLYDFEALSKGTAQGQILGAIRDKPIENQEVLDITQFLDGVFAAVLTDEGQKGQKVSVRVLKGSCKPVKAKAKPKAAEPEADPFEDDEEAAA